MTTTTHAATAAPIDVADLAQLLICEAHEARPDGRVTIQYCDVTIVLWQVADRLPEGMGERTALVVRAVDLAVQTAIASWGAA